MDTISYHSEDIEFSLDDEAKISSWLISVAEKHLQKIEEITYIFCSDDYLHKINLEYLNHDTYTDIITFPYGERDNLEADIFISIERVSDNALAFKSSFLNELLRVMSHGLLHLCGYGDKTEAEKKVMRDREDEAVAMYNIQNT